MDSTGQAKHHPHRWPRALRPFIVRPRLVSAALAGLVVFFLLPPSLRWAARGLLAWDTAIVLFLILVFQSMANADHTTLRRRALRHDEGRDFILLLAIGAAIASVSVIATELASAKGQVTQLELLHVLFTVATISLSWAFMQIIFALHYASIYYGPPRKEGTQCPGGLAFPGGEDPDYWDFLHFAIIMGATAQTADISIVSKEMRRICTAHSLIAFAFNTAILALMINLAAGLF